jgi:hypothetical protein
MLASPNHDDNNGGRILLFFSCQTSNVEVLRSACIEQNDQ